MRRVTAMTAIMALALLSLALTVVTVSAQDPAAGIGAADSDAAEPEVSETDAAAAQAEDDAPPNAALAAFGKSVYRVYCVSCHGAAAEGDGKLAEYLTIKPADLTTLTQRHEGRFPTDRVRRIIDGREPVRGHAGEMPVWGDAFQRVDSLENEPPEVREAEVTRKIDSLVHYLKSIQE